MKNSVYIRTSWIKEQPRPILKKWSFKEKLRISSLHFSQNWKNQELFPSPHSVERYITINCPISTRSKWVTKRNIVLLLVFIWLLALCMALIPYISTSVPIRFNRSLLFCEVGTFYTYISTSAPVLLRGVLRLLYINITYRGFFE